MHKIAICVMVLVASLCAQTEIPEPSGAPAGAVGSPQTARIIGDFDGDGSNDILVSWSWYEEGTNLKGIIGVYSYKRNTYLIVIPEILSGNVVEFGDINNDQKVELLFKGKIYEYTGSASKKKLP